MSTYILGVSPGHESAACLLKDGIPVAAAEEERFTRIKQFNSEVNDGLPYKAIDYCLAEAGIRPEKVTYGAIGWQPGLLLRRMLAFRLAQLPRYPRAALWYSLSWIEAFRRQKKAFYLLQHLLGGRRQSVHLVNHHEAHAASAFFVSPFERAALFVIDGCGERTSTSFGQGADNHLRLTRSIHFPDSWGYLYAMVTRYLGFRPNRDEYRVMGLASYGNPTYLEIFRDIVRLTLKGGFRINKRYLSAKCAWPDVFSPRFYDALGPARTADAPLEQQHMDIACSLQRRLEESVFHMLTWLHGESGVRDLCIAGGVALNCTMNGKILDRTPFERLYVQPAAGDAGTALGAALIVAHHRCGLPRNHVMDDVQLGPAFADAEIRGALDLCKLPYIRTHNEGELLARTADLLAEGRIVAWFQGRMEWGPRALGSRSILADPTCAQMKNNLNRNIKLREDFRPFAPSCAEEAASEYFELESRSPFMLMTCRVRENAREKLPAITHVDGTARVHTVSQQTNPRYHRLLQAFAKRRGVPVLLNTSFNIMGEPIVCHPLEAIRCFSASGMDALVIGDYILQKADRRCA